MLRKLVLIRRLTFLSFLFGLLVSFSNAQTSTRIIDAPTRGLTKIEQARESLGSFMTPQGQIKNGWLYVMNLVILDNDDHGVAKLNAFAREFKDAVNEEIYWVVDEEQSAGKLRRLQGGWIASVVPIAVKGFYTLRIEVKENRDEAFKFEAWYNVTQCVTTYCDIPGYAEYAARELWKSLPKLRSVRQAGTKNEKWVLENPTSRPVNLLPRPIPDISQKYISKQ